MDQRPGIQRLLTKIEQDADIDKVDFRDCGEGQVNREGREGHFDLDLRNGSRNRNQSFILNVGVFAIADVLVMPYSQPTF